MRVLVFHGFRMSAEMMRELLSDVYACLSDEVRHWQYIDAATPSTGPALPFVRRRWPGQLTFEWWNATPTTEGSVEYVGFEQSLAQLERLTDVQRFDLLIGYSQGAAMAALATALLESGRLPNTAGWRGVILLNSGVVPRDPSLKRLMAQPLRLPSLHVGGGPSDFTRAEQRDMLHAWSEQSRTFIEHSEGHAPPSAAKSPEVMHAIRQWVQALRANDAV